MVQSINLNNVRVDSQTGRTTFAGISSNIDSASLIESIVKARRIPIDRIEAEIKTNSSRITGLKDAQAVLQALKDKASKLYGKPSADKSTDLFETKTAFANTSRTDSGTASSAASLLGVTVANNAEVATHSFQVLQRAQAQKVAQASLFQGNTALAVTGTFQLSNDGTTSQSISIIATDTLRDVRDKINNANVGTNATGVSAQIVTITADDTSTTGVDESQERLVLLGTKLGQAIQYTESAGTPLDDLDLTFAGTFKNVVQQAQMAQLQIEDLPNQAGGVNSATAYTNVTDIVPSGRYSIRNLVTGTLEVDSSADTVSTDPGFYVDPGSDLLSFIQSFGEFNVEPALGYSAATERINGTGGVGDYGEPAGVASRDVAGGRLFAEILQPAANEFRLHVFMTTGNYVDVAANPNDPTLIPIAFEFPAQLAGDDADSTDFEYDPVIIERDTNQINDVFQGVTLDLLKAEVGTTVELDIQRDLAAIKTGISDFVSAYNDAVKFLNLQRQIDPETGEAVEDARLQNTAVLSQIESALGLIAGSPARGFGLTYSAMSQIGINFVDNNSLSDVLLEDTLEIDDTSLDSKLLTNLDDIRSLFSFRYSATDSRFVVADFSKETGATTGANINLSVTYGLGSISAASYTHPGGTGTVSISGNFLTFEDGPQKGLKIFFNGDLSGAVTTDNATISTTTGIGGNHFFGLDRILDSTSGIIPNEIGALEDKNELQQSRVTEQERRIEDERAALVERFNRLEATMAQLNALSQQVNAIFGKSSSGSSSS